MSNVYWLGTLAQPIKKTSTPTSRPCSSLSTRHLHVVGISNIASIFQTRFVIMDKNEKMSNFHNELIYFESACKSQPDSSPHFVLSSTSNGVIITMTTRYLYRMPAKVEGYIPCHILQAIQRQFKGDLNQIHGQMVLIQNIYGSDGDPLMINTAIMPLYL